MRVFYYVCLSLFTISQILRSRAWSSQRSRTRRQKARFIFVYRPTQEGELSPAFSSLRRPSPLVLQVAHSPRLQLIVLRRSPSDAFHPIADVRTPLATLLFWSWPPDRVHPIQRRRTWSLRFPSVDFREFANSSGTFTNNSPRIVSGVCTKLSLLTYSVWINSISRNMNGQRRSVIWETSITTILK